ncbi:alpha/beta fold hydrolase [Nakamurella flavida]|uniref:Alpha/beta fold hydrolase n=1 Tax=Nakamurella flavida TaxID=363630 RepID=A0A938YI01_9ACTN|nr:alpha/beta hydrolase [Nakamurella flavida]MBM9478040.1 alpha/beta fold hydrolase [Nakamurella flavida]MDP9778243.1 3-oxoadipate enol-lactonase [Nakamurella flavida]
MTDTTPAPARTEITVDGVRLNYRLEGEGPQTVVLINGLADDLDTWAYQVPDLLAAGYRVLSFDNRGIGASDTPAGPYTTARMAADAKGLVDALGLTDFHLLGVSMGGMIAQEYALAYPQDLASLTLACTYAAPGPFCSRMFAFWGDLAPKLGVPFVMRDVSLWAFTVPFFEERTDEAAEFEAGMAQLTMPVEAYLAQLHAIQVHDTTARLAEITVPTLVLAGEEDILIPVRLSRRLHEGIAGSQFVTVPGGHASLWESPEPFNAAVLAFLQSRQS